MKNISFKNSLIILILISSGFLLFFYSPIIFHPNQYLFSPNGDGISSYYNSLYHIEYDSSYLQFQGMNYPYGEHVTYSVNNPILTNSIKFLDNIFPGINNYTVGIINFSMIISFLFAAIFLFLIFNLLQIDRKLAICSSIGIMLLSPQIFRMQGHLSLAYFFFIPLSFWLLLQSFNKKNKLIWVLLLLISTTIWMLVHPYYAAIIASFLISVALIQIFVKTETIPNRITYGISLILISILPFILYNIVIYFTDNHLCRTTLPYGYLIFTSEPECIFIPHHPPFKQLFYRLFNLNDQNWEGLSYIGMANNIVILYILLIIIRRKLLQKKEFASFTFFQNRFLNVALLSSLVVLVFSTGFPFAIYPKYVPHIFDFLNEFRALGRFSWIFFYASSIFCVFVVNHWIQLLYNKKHIVRKYLIVALFTIIPIIEAIPVHLDVSNSITQTPNYLRSDNSSFQIEESLKKIKIGEFQAILPFPFYHRGSENFTKSPTDKILLLSELMSYKSGLPLMSSYLARTSIVESKNLIQVLSPPEYNKLVKDDIRSKKSFLIIYSKEDLSTNEKEIFKRAELLDEENDFALYRLSYDSLFKKQEQIKNPDEKYIVSEDFEDLPSSISYIGNGALKGKLSDWTMIYRIKTNLIEIGKRYKFSFWIYNCGPNCGQDMVNSMARISYKNDKGEYVGFVMSNPAYSETIDGCWTKVEFTYQFEVDGFVPKTLYLQLKGPDRLNLPCIIDELKIKEIVESD